MKRKVTTCVILTVYAFSMIFMASAQAADSLAQAVKSGKAKSYIVLMANDPVISYEGDIAGLPATKPGKGDKINPNSAHVRKYQKFLNKTHGESQAKANISAAAQIHSYTIALNGYSAILTTDQLQALERQSGVVKVIEDVMRYPDTDASGEFLGLADPAGAWLKGFDGEDVVVGVIDSGIWPEHPSFADDGSYSVLDDFTGLPCEFGNAAHNPSDAPFTCNNKLLGAIQMLDTYRFFIGADPDEFDSARDDDGHGTHTASTAAGNAGVEASILGVPRGVVSGVAPRARVVAYKGIGNLGGFTSDLAAAIDQAVADGVDVINYSIGGGAGLTGADDIAFLFAADAGVFVATSAGNSGPGPGSLGSPGNAPWITTVGASTQHRAFQGSASSSDSWEFFGASITHGTLELPLIDAADAGDELCLTGKLDPLAVTGKIVLCKRGTIARVAKSLNVWLAGGEGMILYNTFDAQNEVTDTHWVPSVHINNTDGIVIKGYIANSSDPVAQINGGEKVYIDAPNMASFSSRGPNPVALDIIKPDITAPGSQILAGHSPFPDPGWVPGELFQAIDGTSMSSPHVAGIFALIKQGYPDWSAAMAKSALMTTAYQDVMKEDGLTPADPFDFGAGHANPGGPAIKGSIFQPGLVYDAGLFEYAAFTCGMELGVFTAGSCDFLASLGIPFDPSDLNLPSIGIYDLGGTQTIQRTVTSVAKDNGWREYTVSVDAPEGFAVTVDPSMLRLKSGQTATYHVTITQVSAPAHEWRHGSLTWTDQSGNYSVYSPISVSAATFAAPETVYGSGAFGDVEFEVGFGYTGSYSAAPHGMVADTQMSSNIEQDPDQTYPSGDDGAGGVDLWSIPVSGSAFVRFELVIPGDDDLDLFLEDSGGNIIASSTNGGTDELIELYLPADDTYTLVVHGWSVPSAPLLYTVSFWDVPLASGGSLSIDEAPATAVLGTVGLVNASWSGLAPGKHLGAVSHTGDSGLMGLTLVEVEVP